MNTGSAACLILFTVFIVFGTLFAVLKEKGVKLVSGFNSLQKDEQERYDKARIVRDMRNQCFIWSGIMFIGAVLSFFLSSYLAIPAFAVWFVLFFKQVHLDVHKAFDKYLK
ncbi:MAG: DUF3784 domain-containing protein [Clostridia bacterium]|nr:DUF3784 domain-containing protein [Clostridia bacterium]MBR6005085.1 DUF3784 domain-containing protein [Clostridia bacterium]